MVVNKWYFAGELESFFYLMEEFLEQLREKAVYFKLTSKPKFGGAVSVNDVIKVLESLKESYTAFVEAEYNLINTQQDRKKLNVIKKGLIDENNLVIVDLKFESYGMSVTPNVVTYTHSIPLIKNQTDWKKDVFESYKSIVLDSDFNDENYLQEVSRRYNPIERKNIFKPIVDGIVNNERAKTSFGIGNKPVLKSLSKPNNTSYSVLVPVPSDKKLELPVDIRTSLAMVEIKGNASRPRVLELFDEIKNPIYSFDKIEFGENKYKLKFPIYCELIHSEDGYSMESKELGIYAFGEKIEDAQYGFFEEFDYIYNRYKSLADEQLTDDVISIKNFLNLIVVS